jgi:hypothetical protein
MAAASDRNDQIAPVKDTEESKRVAQIGERRGVSPPWHRTHHSRIARLR